MKCSLGISNFLEEISSLSHSVVFFYFFALIAEEGFLISSCYSLELSIQMLISFLFSFSPSHLSHVQLFVTLWSVVCQAPLSMGFSRQEYWIGLPCPPPGNLPYPGIKSMFSTSPALASGFFTPIWEVHIRL